MYQRGGESFVEVGWSILAVADCSTARAPLLAIAIRGQPSNLKRDLIDLSSEAYLIISFR